jgi:hypothetical protein
MSPKRGASQPAPDEEKPAKKQRVTAAMKKAAAQEAAAQEAATQKAAAEGTAAQEAAVQEAATEKAAAQEAAAQDAAVQGDASQNAAAQEAAAPEAAEEAAAPEGEAKAAAAAAACGALVEDSPKKAKIQMVLKLQKCAIGSTPPHASAIALPPRVVVAEVPVDEGRAVTSATGDFDIDTFFAGINTLSAASSAPVTPQTSAPQTLAVVRARRKVACKQPDIGTVALVADRSPPSPSWHSTTSGGAASSSLLAADIADFMNLPVTQAL